MQRDRYPRENLDEMARKVGELQANLIMFDVTGERVSTADDARSDEFEEIPTSGANVGPGGPCGQGGPIVQSRRARRFRSNG